MPSQTGSIDLTAQVSANNNAKDYSDTVVDNLEIGGRNLLLNSKVPIPTLAPYNNSATSKYNTPALDGVDYYYCSGTRYWRIDFPTLISGETYNLWFDIARSADSRPVFVKIGSTEQNIGTALARAWKRLGLSFVASTDTYAEIRVAIDSTGTQNDYIAALRNVKLEKGNKATDWTPAPEDVNADISAAESSAKGYADTKKTEAISAAATDATNKANVAAQTATNYITADANGISIHMAGNSTTYQRQTSDSTTFYVGGKKRSQVGADGLKVYVGADETEMASFGASTRIGKAYVEGATDNESHLELDYHSMRMIDKEGTKYFEVQDLRDESGTVRVSAVRTGNGSTKEFRFDYTVEIDSVAVFVNGTEVTSGWTATNPTDPLFTETLVTFTTAPASGSEIMLTGDVTDPTVTIKMKLYTLGIRSDGTGGEYSFATGYLVSASGARSQAHGIGTRATHADETVIGRYNAGAGSLSKRFSDASNGMALIVGNGSSSSRSNALEVAWDGTITHYGDVPWTDFPLANTAKHYSSDKPLRYRKWGKMVNLVGAVSPKSEVAAGQDNYLVIGTLPAECRPAAELVELCQGSGTTVWMLRITTGGVVRAERYRSFASGYIVMPTTAWLTFNTTFIVA